MPGQVIVVHDVEAFRTSLVKALGAEGYSVACYPDALAASEVLTEISLLELLITKVRFEPRRSNGINLALMLKTRNPRLPVIFVAAPETREHVSDEGLFMPMPVAVPDVVRAVRSEIGSPPAGEGSVRYHCKRGDQSVYAETTREGRSYLKR
jgi:CheY-like chemotaxis protein